MTTTQPGAGTPGVQPPITEPMLQYQAADEAIAAVESVLIVTHLHPDGDAVGSLVALAHMLRQRGKTVTAAVDGGMPDYLAFLPNAETVQAAITPGEWPLMISVDASDEERTGAWGAYGRAHSAQVINIDHHPTNTRFGDVFIIHPRAVSTTEILFDWFSHSGYAIDRPTAVALLTGLVTDTMGFVTSNVSGRTLAIAQRLLEAGASLTEITARTLNSKPYSTVELWKHALQTVTLEGGVISAVISQRDFQAVGLSEPSDSGLVSFLNAVNEASAAITFRETGDGSVSVSMRCKPGFDVSQVAFALGGGGHKQAAGATVPGPLLTVRDRVLPLLKTAVQQGQLTIE